MCCTLGGLGGQEKHTVGGVASWVWGEDICVDDWTVRSGSGQVRDFFLQALQEFIAEWEAEDENVHIQEVTLSSSY